MTITEFLLERISEDEEVANDRLYREWWTREMYVRALAECKAKRRIVEREPSVCSGYEDQDEYDEYDPHHYPDPEWSFCDGCAAAESADADWQWTLRVLAAVYADHPDFQPEWLAT